MKIIYLANIRLPTEKAHGLQIMKTCEALSENGAEVVLVVPTRNNLLTENPFDFYQVAKSFNLTFLPTIDLIKFGSVGFTLSSVFFSLKALIYNLRQSADWLYTRDLLPAVILSLFSSRVVWESHEGKRGLLVQWLKFRGVRLVVITKQGKTFYENLGWPKNAVLVAPDAVDLNQFSLTMNKEEARIKVGNLPLNKKVVAYVGSLGLYDWKGVDIFLTAISNLVKSDELIVGLVVGGKVADQQKIIAEFNLVELVEAKRIVFVPQVKPEFVPIYLRAVDLLVIPNKAGNVVSEQFTSPMKLFEYLASGTPIVASELPSITEVLTQDNSFLFRPNNSTDLAEVIKKTLMDEVEITKRVNQGLKLIQDFSWAKRAQILINFLS